MSYKNLLKRRVVIIVTFMRSGSTFVGEIFNNHPNAFYQFEPLHEFYQFGCDAKTDLKYESLLGQGTPNFRPTESSDQMGLIPEMSGSGDPLLRQVKLQV